MDCPPFLISTIINQECSVPALVDSGCLSYGLIDSQFVRKHNFERVAISPRTMEAFDAPVSGVVREVAAVVLDVNGVMGYFIGCLPCLHFTSAPRISRIEYKDSTPLTLSFSL